MVSFNISSYQNNVNVANGGNFPPHITVTNFAIYVFLLSLALPLPRNAAYNVLFEVFFTRDVIMHQRQPIFSDCNFEAKKYLSLVTITIARKISKPDA